MKSSGLLSWLSLLTQTLSLPTYRSRVPLLCLSKRLLNESTSHSTTDQESFQRLESFQSQTEDLSPLTLPERYLLSVSKINPKKAAGSDGAISNWLLKESAEILACPVTTVLTSVSLS